MRRSLFVVEGMTCSACTNTIVAQVESLEGVKNCQVSLVTNECVAVYDESLSTVQDILNCIEDCGFDCEFISTDVQETASSDLNLNLNLNLGLLTVQGMTCSACTSTITNQLEKINGVEDVQVSLVTEECHVKFVPSVVSIQDIKETIEDCGFDANIVSQVELNQDSNKIGSHLKKIPFKLIGLNESSNVNELELFFNDINKNGLISNISVEDGSATIEYNQDLLGIRSIVNNLNSFGYDVMVNSTLDNSTQLKLLSRIKEIQYWKSTFIKSFFISVLNMLLYMWIPMGFPHLMKQKLFPYNQTFIKGLYYRDVISFIFTTYVQFKLGIYFYRATWSSYKHGAGTMDTLVCISTTFAYTFSIYSIIYNINNKNSSDALPNVIFSTSSMLIAFISFGKYLENKAKAKTSTALSKLISLTPSTCTILENGDASSPLEISTEYLQPGDIIEVRAGMRIPADGIITSGETEIDESLMTGESLYVPKSIGDAVIGGTVNGIGLFYFKATNIGDDTRLSNIIKTMKQAQMTKAPIQRYADYLASIFVPCILFLSLMTFIIWGIVCKVFDHLPPVFADSTHGKFYMCFQIAISVVVVACPCALGLAAPTAIMVGTGIGAENGVLIKGGDKLELFNAIKIFIFDKTGTLTTGCMDAETFIPENNVELTGEYIMVIKAACGTTEHPVSKAIKNYCEMLIMDQNISVPTNMEIISNETVLGKGIKCRCEVNGKSYDVIIGSKKLFSNELKDDVNVEDGYTVSFVSINGKLIGRFEIVDSVKSDAYDTVQYLMALGYQCYMVTGDNHSSAMKIANTVGIPYNNVYSEVTPDGKCEIVAQLQNETNEKIAFVGDGINDSPALVSSDLGIAISTGTDIALEAADVVILSDEDPKRSTLKRLAYALNISQKTFRRIKMNLFWALFYNTFMIPVAMGLLAPWGIILHPIAASLAMAMSSVSVVLSSLALKRWKPFDITTAPIKRQASTRDTTHSWLKPFHLTRTNNSSQDIELQTNLLNNDDNNDNSSSSQSLT
ncbi:hypothetical protein Kpol_526p42 [Vanderwaltozyma polyspora DSM 70294]|uniref:HMA domain-containing protein n=1 Tax=Vanderwaltozyma polyspora (strain ATCC 22028 / DSM 70294 / BCRC 21397 / CBS 2163 / NBRC 10782 / NRRL Y-8283 / UCD 57-17) TaxID=436907 RepID=A7TLU7_VANPO|nr:uncharacterized protein Kpol_526p42 [Vanderwaltozyma polyspora DSM 70294]EDO16789.1 hypothetical protein Kpol_526p42 [Vanderwaltozyma polyspora DSM 70294]